MIYVTEFCACFGYTINRRKPPTGSSKESGFATARISVSDTYAFTCFSAMNVRRNVTAMSAAEVTHKGQMW